MGQGGQGWGGSGKGFREGKAAKKGWPTKSATQCAWEIVQNMLLGMIPLEC